MNFEKLSDIIRYYQNYHLTKNKYHYRLAALAPFDDTPLSMLKRADVKKWEVGCMAQVSNATVNREISFARAAINTTASDYELNLNNPFANVKYLEAEVIPSYLTPNEYQRLLESALHFENYGWQLCKKRALVNCRMHDIRHTYASWLVQKGVPIYTVKELLGHGDIASTQRYAHLDYATKIDALSLIG